MCKELEYQFLELAGTFAARLVAARYEQKFHIMWKKEGTKPNGELVPLS